VDAVFVIRFLIRTVPQGNVQPARTRRVAAGRNQVQSDVKQAIAAEARCAKVPQQTAAVKGNPVTAIVKKDANVTQG